MCRYDKLQTQYDKLQADAEMRKESYQRQQSRLVGEMDVVKAGVARQEEQRSHGIDELMVSITIRSVSILGSI